MSQARITKRSLRADFGLTNETSIYSTLTNVEVRTVISTSLLPEPEQSEKQNDIGGRSANESDASKAGLNLQSCFGLDISINKSLCILLLTGAAVLCFTEMQMAVRDPGLSFFTRMPCRLSEYFSSTITAVALLGCSSTCC